MTGVEEPVVFRCMGLQLLGVLHRPPNPRSRAVLIVVGGPQYRVGSHRQFLLLARSLAEHGTPVLRFDCRGMGDSQGDAPSFEDIGPDIHAAVDTIFDHLPGLTDVVIWGLCDAASAAMIHAYRDSRISGLVIANPWARTEDGIARTHLQRYYRTQLFDSEFWRRLLTGRVRVVRRILEFFQVVRRVWRGRRMNSRGEFNEAPGHSAAGGSYIDNMRHGFKRFKGQVLIIISGDDLTAAEFDICVSASTEWRELMRRPAIKRYDFAEANHTFSQRTWRDQVAVWTDEWLKSW